MTRRLCSSGAALLKKSRVELRSSCWSSDSSKRMSSGLRQAEHDRGDDVGVHLGRSRVDGARARPQELARPVDVGPRVRARAQELAFGTEQVDRRLPEALVELAPEDLLERRLRAGRLALGERREHAHAVRAHDLDLDQQPGHLLARPAGEPAALLERRRQEAQIAREALGVGERAGAALVGEDRHRDPPALADLADQVLLRHAGVLEEDLAELALAGDLAQRPHRDAGGVELAEDERDAAVAVPRIGAAEHEDPVGPWTESGPHLLAVQDEVVAVEHGAGLERRQVTARARLAEPLAPDLVAREHGRDEAPALRLAAVVNERRAEEADAEDVQDGRRVGARQLRLEDRLLDLGGAPASPLLRPSHAEVAALVQLALPSTAELYQGILGGGGVAQLLAPGTAQARLQPAAQLLLEGERLGRQLEVHRGCLGPLPAACQRAGVRTVASVPRPEQAERARVPVQEGRSLHRTDLAVAEETAERDVADVTPERPAVVVRLAVEMLPATEAREEQRTRRPATVAGQQLVQVGGGRVRVPQVELHDHAVADQRPHHQGAALAVDAHDVADQKVAMAIFLAVLAHDDAEEEGVPEQLLVVRIRLVVESLEDAARTAPIQLVDHVALAAGDEHRLADRPAALRHDRVHGDVAGERDADEPAAMNRVAEVE